MREFKIIRSAGAVKRFHTVETLRTQTIAEHSWHVAQIVKHIYPNASGALIMAALNHDIPEYLTGDVPAPFKWVQPSIYSELKRVEAEVHDDLGTGHNLSHLEEHILKFADMMELVLWCEEEMRMGNSSVMEMHQRGVDYLHRLGAPVAKAEQMLLHNGRSTSVKTQVAGARVATVQATAHAHEWIDGTRTMHDGRVIPVLVCRDCHDVKPYSEDCIG